ncbi:MAG: transcription antitermination factor NusB [Candidatus Krumholzibacteriota bacterium]|nr:transcription antitermination factor NusB [Candidatus Krumholzibacteriota bacterium]
MSRRRKAREIALQILYAQEMSGSDLEDIFRDVVDRRKSSEEASSYAYRLIGWVAADMDKLDRLIADCLENWKMERVAAIDRIILRIALTELLHCPEVPTSVIINEAIEVAHRFSSEKAGAFVNGILDRLAREVRSA